MISVRTARPEEYKQIGRMLVDVYSGIDGFPKPDVQPSYYKMLLNVGDFSLMPETEIMVASDDIGNIKGAVVYFADIKYYGSGGTANQEPNAAGFRLLGVETKSRGLGIAKMLTVECIQKARLRNRATVVIHTTHAMMNAWRMYEKIGFRRAYDLDFVQGELPVFGFRYSLQDWIL